jgi:hypothetical protein
MSPFLIYALVDPRDGQWRYIGKSCRGLKRPEEHLRPSYLKASTRKNAWMKSLVAQGLMYETVVLEEFGSAGELDDAEREWIAEARRVGVRLVNGTDGGDGTAGGRWSWTEESRANLSAHQRGRVSTFKGRSHRREAVLKNSLSRGGSTFVDDLGRRYETLKDAAEVTGASVYNISAVLHGRRRVAGGRSFVRVES